MSYFGYRDKLHLLLGFVVTKTTVVFELIGGLMITAGSIVELETGTIVELEIISCGLLLVSGRIMIGDVMSNVVGSTGGLRYLPMHA